MSTVNNKLSPKGAQHITSASWLATASSPSPHDPSRPPHSGKWIRLIEVTRAVGRHIHGGQRRWDTNDGWAGDQVKLDVICRYVMPGR